MGPIPTERLSDAIGSYHHVRRRIESVGYLVTGECVFDRVSVEEREVVVYWYPALHDDDYEVRRSSSLDRASFPLSYLSRPDAEIVAEIEEAKKQKEGKEAKEFKRWTLENLRRNAKQLQQTIDDKNTRTIKRDLAKAELALAEERIARLELEFELGRELETPEST